MREKGASRIGVGLCRNSSPSPEEHLSHEHNRLRADRCQLKTEEKASLGARQRGAKPSIRARQEEVTRTSNARVLAGLRQVRRWGRVDPRGMGPDPPKRPKALDFELCGNAGANQQKNGAVGNESRPFRGTHVGRAIAYNEAACEEAETHEIGGGAAQCPDKLQRPGKRVPLTNSASV